MSFTNIVGGNPIIASVVMANFRHVNYGNDLMPVDFSGVYVDNTINLGSTSKRWGRGYFNNAYFSGNVGVGTQSVSSLGTNITTLGIKGLSNARSGGTYWENLDASIKFGLYGATDESASNPFAFGTLTNHGFRVVANNTAVGLVTASGNFGFGPMSPSTRVLISGARVSTGFTVNNTTAILAVIDTTTPSAVGVGGKVAFGSTYGTLGNTMATAAISSYKENAPDGTSAEYSHSLVFEVSNSSLGVFEAGRFSSSGKFGIGTGTTLPAAFLHVKAVTEQFRLSYDNSNFFASVVSNTGSITWSLTGTTPTFNLSNRVLITPASVSGVQEALRLVDSGSGATEGSYIRWDNSDRTDMARIGGSSEGTGGGLGFWVNAANSGTPTQSAYLSAAGNFGFGTTTVSARGHFVSTTEQIRFGYDLSNYGSISSSSSGVISIGGSLGIVSIPNQPAVRAYKSSAQSLASGSSGAVVTMDSEDFDVGGLHSTSSNTERITAVIDGNYMFNATVEFGNGNTGSGRYFLIYLRKNGTVIRGAYAKSAPTPDTETILNINSVVPLVAGDYVDCVAVQTTGTPVNIGPTSGTTAIEAIKLS